MLSKFQTARKGKVVFILKKTNFGHAGFLLQISPGPVLKPVSSWAAPGWLRSPQKIKSADCWATAESSGSFLGNENLLQSGLVSWLLPSAITAWSSTFILLTSPHIKPRGGCSLVPVFPHLPIFMATAFPPAGAAGSWLAEEVGCNLPAILLLSPAFCWQITKP